MYSFLGILPFSVSVSVLGVASAKYILNDLVANMRQFKCERKRCVAAVMKKKPQSVQNAEDKRIHSKRSGKTRTYLATRGIEWFDGIKNGEMYRYYG